MKHEQTAPLAHLPQSVDGVGGHVDVAVGVFAGPRMHDLQDVDVTVRSLGATSLAPVQQDGEVRAPAGGGAGLVVEVRPDLVPAVVGAVAAQGEDAGGAGGVPAHAGQLEALADDTLAAGSTTPEPTNMPRSRKTA